MHGLDLFEDDTESTVFRDVIMLALLGFMIVAVVMLPHLNPKARATGAAVPPGNVFVEVRWPDDVDADIDLWVVAPGDSAVGYSNRGGRVFNLLRDDLGKDNDETKLNYELAFSRGAPAGEYAVNLHLYQNLSGRLPVTATVVISLQSEGDTSARRIVSKQVNLMQVGEEQTIARFTLDGQGRLVSGSIHTLPRRLRMSAIRQ